MTDVTRIFDLLPHFKEKFSQYEVFAKKENDVWRKYFIDEYILSSNYVSSALLELGLKKGDTIVTIMDNCPEWNFLDIGMAQIGVVHVPVYPTISRNEYEYIISHCKAKIIFLSQEQYCKKLNPILDKLTHVIEVYSFCEFSPYKNWGTFFDLGKKVVEKHAAYIENIKKTIKPTDLFSIIYTSGTTGISKGVMLSHHNLISNVKDSEEVHVFKENMKSISFLPLCHVFERAGNYTYQFCGTSIYYAESIEKIADNIKEIKPHGFLTVPRLLEKLYNQVATGARRLPLIQRMLFFWAINIGFKYDLEESKNWYYSFRREIANKLIYYRWREALGGNIKCIISGGAVLQTRIERIFWATGMPVQNGYGLTETSPTITANKNKLPDIKFGTVGVPIKNVLVKIAEDGEILVKGPNVMMGYYKNEELTKKVIDKDGWFHTGDIGEFIDDKFLTVTDRKKEIFKLSTGKYIAPQVIETKLKESLFINHIIVVGENRKFASAIIIPNFTYLHDWCYIHKIRFRDNKNLIHHKKVIDRIQKEIDKLNQDLGRFEQIRKFVLIDDIWSPKSGELTPTLKLKREQLTYRYRRLINRFYVNEN